MQYFSTLTPGIQVAIIAVVGLFLFMIAVLIYMVLRNNDLSIVTKNKTIQLKHDPEEERAVRKNNVCRCIHCEDKDHVITYAYKTKEILSLCVKTILDFLTTFKETIRQNIEVVVCEWDRALVNISPDDKIIMRYIDGTKEWVVTKIYETAHRYIDYCITNNSQAIVASDITEELRDILRNRTEVLRRQIKNEWKGENPIETVWKECRVNNEALQKANERFTKKIGDHIDKAIENLASLLVVLVDLQNIYFGIQD